MESPDTRERFNIRFIKPSQKFYNLLMSVWMNLDWPSSDRMKSFEEYLEIVKERIGLMNWKDPFTEAVKQFFTVAREEHLSIEEEAPLAGFDYTSFFSNVKGRLLTMWNENIVFKIKESS